jgi:mono/diheme cytochrome c family protein
MKNPTRLKLSTQLPVLLVIFVIAIFLVACGSTPETQTAPPMPSTAETTVEQPVPTFEPTEETESPADTQAPSTSEGEASFSKDILPIFQISCFQCHGTGGGRGGFNLSNYDQLMAGGNSGAAIEPGDADSSLLVQLIIAQRMPMGGTKLTPEQIQLITDWVNQGALDN